MGIQMESTAGLSSESNGIVERHNLTLLLNMDGTAHARWLGRFPIWFGTS
jgi:hypothetical protein